MLGVRRSALVVVGIGLLLITASRLQIRHSERAIWQQAVAHSPEKPRPWVNLGRQYALDGAAASAADAYRTAIDLAEQPARLRVEGAMRGHHTARLNLALLHADQGQFADALTLTAPIHPRARVSLVTMLETQWRTQLVSR